MKNLVSAFLVSLIFVSGCVTSPDGKKQLHWAGQFVIERAVERGTREYLRKNPQDTMKFQNAKTAVLTLMRQTNFTGQDLGRILQTLPIDKFKGADGELYASDVAVVYDFIREVATRVDKKELLIPAASAIVAGFDRAILLSHLQMPKDPPVLPTPSVLDTNKLVVERKAKQTVPTSNSHTSRAMFQPAAAGPPTTNHLVWSPWITNGAAGTPVFRAYALKKFDKGIKVHAKYQGITGPNWFVDPLYVPCYPERQEWIFEGSTNFANATFWLEELDCPSGFTVASAELALGPAFEMDTPNGRRVVSFAAQVKNGPVYLRAFKVIK